MYIRFFKRIIDLIIALFLLILVSPLLIITLITLSIANKGKPFFLQDRPGKNEQVFKLIKFKTMADKYDKEGKLLPDQYRVTKIGKLIRKASIDEILQLVNVLRGEMSIVGPRPLSVKYLDLYNEIQKKRHLVLPGITGLAQVNGRNAISWNKKFEYDVLYVENLNFLLDLKIIFMTVIKIIRRDDVKENGQGMVESFNGFN